jgi:hypothetical protein
VIGVADTDGADVGSRTIVADNDIEVGILAEKETGAETYDDVAAAGGIVKQGERSISRVKAAGGVA